MPEIEERIARLAVAELDAAPPVTLVEIQARARRKSPPWVRLLGVAAVALAVVGVASAVLISDREKTTVVASTQFPLTLDGHRDWVLALINEEISPDDEELRARYTPEFLEAIPPHKFRDTTRSLQETAPWRVLAEVERRGEEVLVVQLAADGGEQARLTVHRTPTGQLDGSTILMATQCGDAVALDASISPPLSSQLDWIKEVLATDRDLTEEEITQRFAASFMTNVPPAQLQGAIAELRALGPFSMRNYEDPPLEFSLAARVGLRSGAEARLTLSVESKAPHRITGFAVFTQAPCRMPTA